ncbi:MAG: hypothetical protein ACTHK8_20795 [Ginsengibacter sp.]
MNGFQEWPNLNKTELNGILAACVLKGTVEYKFFKLSNEGKLIDLNISETDSLLDGKAYDKGLLKVKQLIK